MNRKLLVLYHGGCGDGFCAAWVVHHLKIDADCLPVYYDQAPPDVADRDVLVIDFSYQRDLLLEMKKKAASLLLLDHHKTAAENLGDLDFCKFDMEKSGCGLTWDHFTHGQGPPPWLVAYTEDRDLWRWALPASREVNAALRSYPRRFEVWDELAKRDGRSFIPEGEAVARFQDQLVRAIVKTAREVEIDGYRVLSANTSVLLSEVAGVLTEGRPFGMAWFQRPDGRRSVSLRSRPEGVDVSEIAKRHGGGGHRNAAGYIE